MQSNVQSDRENVRILVVDDSPGIRDILSEFMTSEGYDVLTASDACAALKKIEEEPPHIVLLDIRMPDIDGLQCLKMIQERFPTIQVVMISGFATQQMAESALKHGAFDYLDKPVNFDRLMDVLQKIEQTRLLDMM